MGAAGGRLLCFHPITFPVNADILREWVVVYVYFKDESDRRAMQPYGIKVLERNCK